MFSSNCVGTRTRREYINISEAIQMKTEVSILGPWKGLPHMRKDLAQVQSRPTSDTSRESFRFDYQWRVYIHNMFGK